jgi:hypothetical protein
MLHVGFDAFRLVAEGDLLHGLVEGRHGVPQAKSLCALMELMPVRLRLAVLLEQAVLSQISLNDP